MQQHALGFASIPLLQAHGDWSSGQYGMEGDDDEEEISPVASGSGSQPGLKRKSTGYSEFGDEGEGSEGDEDTPETLDAAGGPKKAKKTRNSRAVSPLCSFA